MFKIVTPLALLVNCYLHPVTRHDPLTSRATAHPIENVDTKIAVESFAKETFGSEVRVREHRFSADFAEEGSSTIYFVFDSENHKKGVIKSLSASQEKNSFDGERRRLSTLDSTASTQFSHPHLLAHTTYGKEEKKRGLIAQDMAKGTSINTLLKQLAISPPHSKQHTQHMLTSLRAMERTGVGLADLHTQKKALYLAEEYEYQYDDLQESQGLTPISIYPGPYGMIHGDTHPGNIFYDPDSDTLSLIDFGSAYLSINPRHPVGAPAGDDVANFIITMRAAATYYGLPPADIDLLEATFCQAYLEANPHFTQETLDIYMDLISLDYIQNFSDIRTHPFGQSHFYAHHYGKVIPERTIS